MNIISFLKNWTLPVAITIGTVSYLTFYYVPQLDELGTELAPIFDVIFPLFVFLTLWVTFCKVDFHQMRPHRWHIGILIAQLLLVAVNIGVILWMKHLAADNHELPAFASPLLWEALLTCIIGPAASAAPVVTGKLGGNISTMTTYVLISSLTSALLIPLVFPMLEQAIQVSFVEAFLIILEKVSIVLLLPLVLGWIMQHYVKGLCAKIVAMPNLSFYFWSVSLSITTGITVKNIMHSEGYFCTLLCTVWNWSWYRSEVGRRGECWSGIVPEEYSIEHLGCLYVSSSCCFCWCRLLCVVAEHYQLIGTVAV